MRPRPPAFSLAVLICLAGLPRRVGAAEDPRVLATAGGLAGWEGPASALGDPGALAFWRDREAALGCTNLDGKSASPGLSLGEAVPVAGLGYALGGDWDRAGPAHPRSAWGAGAWAPLDWLGAGFASEGRWDAADVAVRYGAGLAARLPAGFSLGAALSNISATSLPADSGVPGASARAWRLLAAWRPGPRAWLGYDAEDLGGPAAAHEFSAGAWLGPGGMLALRAGGRLPQGSGARDMTAGVGAGFRVGLGPCRVEMDYAMGRIPLSSRALSPGALTHGLSFSLLPGPPPPPPILGRADAQALAPVIWLGDSSARGDTARMLFRTAVEGGAGALSWSLPVCAADSDGRVRGVVRVFGGRELPPRIVAWDGADGRGRRLPAGIYAYRLLVGDRWGRLWSGPWRLAELRRGVPPVRDSIPDTWDDDPASAGR